MSIQSRAMLVSFHASQWKAEIVDHQQTAEVAMRNGTPKEAQRVIKSLLAAPELTTISKLVGKARSEFYFRTLPWERGVFILKSTSYFPFMEAMTPLIDEVRRAHINFINVYPQRVEDAKQLHKGRWRAEDYPPVDVVRSRFSIDINFAPIPDRGDWRVDIPEEEKERTERAILAVAAEATKAAWQRVYDLVKASHTSLANTAPGSRFHADALVENAKALVSVLPTLNINDDPEMDRMGKEIEAALCRHNPDTLKQAPDVRQQATDRMSDLMKQLEKLGVA